MPKKLKKAVKTSAKKTAKPVKRTKRAKGPKEEKRFSEEKRKEPEKKFPLKVKIKMKKRLNAVVHKKEEKEVFSEEEKTNRTAGDDLFGRVHGSAKEKDVSSRGEIFPSVSGKESSEKDKKLMLWSGVTFFMILVMIIWIFNTRQVFQEIEKKNREYYSSFDLEKMTDDLGKKMEQVKNGLEEIKEFTGRENAVDVPESAGETGNFNSDASGTSEADMEIIENLKKNLEEKHGEM